MISGILQVNSYLKNLAFIAWVTSEIDDFSDTFNKRVFSVDDFQVIGECIQKAHFHCQTLLPDDMYMGFLLQQKVIKCFL